MSNVAMPDLVAIFGTGRNGSTLLARLLDGIPGTYLHPVEANFLSAMNDLAWLPVVRRRTRQNVVTAPLKRLDGALPIRRLLRYYDSHFREIERDYLPQIGVNPRGPAPAAALMQQARWRAADFVPAFLAATARWIDGSEPQYAIFKTIETPYIADYERLFPTMRFIHILRHPVDVWASSKRSWVENKGLPPWYQRPDNLITTIESRWMAHASAVAVRPGDARHFVLRYEDLVRRPGATIAQICTWLGVASPAEPEMQTLLGGHHPREMQFNPSQRGVETPRRAVADLHERNSFVPVMAPRERDLILLRTQNLRRSLGYPFEPIPPAAAIRRSWRRIDEWDFRNVRGLSSWVRGLLGFALRRRYVRRVCREATQAHEPTPNSMIPNRGSSPS